MRLTVPIVTEAYARCRQRVAVNSTWGLSNDSLCPIAAVAIVHGNAVREVDLAGSIGLSLAYTCGFLDGWRGKSSLGGRLTDASLLKQEIVLGHADGKKLREHYRLEEGTHGTATDYQ